MIALHYPGDGNKEVIATGDFESCKLAVSEHAAKTYSRQFKFGQSLDVCVGLVHKYGPWFTIKYGIIKEN